MIDRLGNCPHCKINWDGGDIRDTLSMLDVNTHETKGEINKLAANYGWSETDKKRFTKALVYEFNMQPTDIKVTFYECPECRNAFDAETGKQYNSIQLAKDSLVEEVMDELGDTE